MNDSETLRSPVRRSERFSLARLLDGVAFVALAALLSFIFFSSRIQSPVVAALPSALFTAAAAAAFLLFRQRRLRRRKMEIERQAYDLWLCDEMLKSEPGRFQKFALNILLFQCRYRYVPPEEGGPRLVMDDKTSYVAVLRRHPSAPVTAQDMIELVDAARGAGLTSLVAATTAEFTKEAREFAKAVPGVEVSLFDGSKLSSMAWDGAVAPPPDALGPYMERAGELLKKKRKQSRPKFAALGVAVRFALTGLLLFAIGWLTPFHTWYLACSAACFVIAASAVLFPNLRYFRRKAA
jgi:hypothetical protein